MTIDIFKAHAAIMLSVPDKLKMDRAKEIVAAVKEATKSFVSGEPEHQLWIAFADLEMANIQLPCAPCPADIPSLDALVQSIPEVRKYSVRPDFVYGAKEKVFVTTKPIKKEIVEFSPHSCWSVSPIPDRVTLPLGLRFAACQQAMDEAFKIYRVYDSWPMNDDDHLYKWSKKLVADFSERYPMLAQIDQAIDGALTRVIIGLGKRPHQQSWRVKWFWEGLKEGKFGTLRSSCESFLEIIESDIGNPERWFEEEDSEAFQSNVSTIRMTASRTDFEDGHDGDRAEPE